MKSANTFSGVSQGNILMDIGFETDTKDFFYFQVMLDRSLNLTIQKQMICYNESAKSNNFKNFEKLRKEEMGDDQKLEHQTNKQSSDADSSFSPSAPSVDDIAANQGSQTLTQPQTVTGKRTMKSIVVNEFGNLIEGTKNTSLSSDQMLKAKQLIELKKAMKK